MIPRRYQGTFPPWVTRASMRRRNSNRDHSRYGKKGMVWNVWKDECLRHRHQVKKLNESQGPSSVYGRLS